MLTKGVLGSHWLLLLSHSERVKKAKHVTWINNFCTFYHMWRFITKTHVRGFFDTDLHEVSWHFATHEAVRGSKFNWPSEDQCQRSHSKWVFVFIPHLKSKYSQLIVSKLSPKSPICPRRSPWRLIVLVRSLRSARFDAAWLVKSVTFFNLIGYIGGCVRAFQRSKYKSSSHPKTLELTG